MREVRESGNLSHKPSPSGGGDTTDTLLGDIQQTCQCALQLFCVSPCWSHAYSTGIIRLFTKQIATEGFSTVFGQSRCAL